MDRKLRTFDLLSQGCSFRPERQSGAALATSRTNRRSKLDFFGAHSNEPAPQGQAARTSGRDALPEPSLVTRHPASRRRRAKRRRSASNDSGDGELPLFQASGKADEGRAGVQRAERQVEAEGRVRLEEIRAFRRRMRISVVGNHVPDPIGTFGELTASSPALQLVLRNVEMSSYAEPTPVQMQAIPALLAGRDVMACAPTGSGKTAAFLVPLILLLGSPRRVGGVRSLVVAPTRELATQIMREFTRLSSGKKFRACVLRKATQSAASGDYDLIVTTPMRLVHMIQAEEINLSTVRHLVVDEVDKLLEMDFVEQLDLIVAAAGRGSGDAVQRALFSATLPHNVQDLALGLLRDEVRITVGVAGAGASTIDQRLLFVGREEGKLLAFRQLLQEGALEPPAIIFVQSKERAKELYSELVYDGINVEAMHAERTQAQRDALVNRFRAGSLWFLIATDLAGRGLDFKGVNAVLNWDFPTSTTSYVHRIGRTGRAGRTGCAVTFFTLADLEALRSIANVMRLSGCDVPAWMLSLKKQRSKERRRLQKNPTARRTISTVSRYDEKRMKRRQMIVEGSKRRSAKKANAKANEPIGV